MVDRPLHPLATATTAPSFCPLLRRPDLLQRQLERHGGRVEAHSPLLLSLDIRRLNDLQIYRPVLCVEVHVRVREELFGLRPFHPA